MKDNCFTEFCCLSLLDFNFLLLQICILHSIILLHFGLHFPLNSFIILTILTLESLIEYSILSNYRPYFFCVHVYVYNLMDSLFLKIYFMFLIPLFFLKYNRHTALYKFKVYSYFASYIIKSCTQKNYMKEILTMQITTMK